MQPIPIRRSAAIAFAGSLVCFAPSQAPAAETWLKLKSSHFELVTTAGEKKGREAILYFEQVHSFFVKANFDPKLGSSAPVRIVAFRSEKEFKPYRINDFATAFYVGRSDRDYIVMSSIAAENYQVAVHEFTHLLANHSGIEIPAWFNEGTADLFSTLKPVGDKVWVGAIIPGRYRVLQESKWLDLETLTAVDHNSPHYNERDRAGIFYAQSWALVHMLTLSAPYRPQYPKFLKLLGASASAAVAFQQAYGMTLDRVQKDLAQYMRGTQFNAAVFNIKLEKSAETPEIHEAAPVESGIALADLLALTNKREEAKLRYEGLAKDFPQSWEAEAGLAELFLRDQDTQEARRHFARAVELGSTNARLYYTYSLMLRAAGEKETTVIPLLRKAVELQPDFQDAHHYLASCLLHERNYAEAVDHFGRVKQVKVQQAFAYYQGLAYANHQLGQREEAKKAAEGARKFARNPQEIAAAEELLRMVSQERAVQVEERAPAVVATDTEPATPILRRKAPEETVPEKPKQLIKRSDAAEAMPAPVKARPSIQGTLLQVDCLGKVARLRVLAGQKQVALAVTDPQAVTVKGSPRGTLDLTCGSQKGKSVILEYESRPDARLGTLGTVRSIEFQ